MRPHSKCRANTVTPSEESPVHCTPVNCGPKSSPSSIAWQVITCPWPVADKGMVMSSPSVTNKCSTSFCGLASSHTTVTYMEKMERIETLKDVACTADKYTYCNSQHRGKQEWKLRCNTLLQGSMDFPFGAVRNVHADIKQSTRPPVALNV